MGATSDSEYVTALAPELEQATTSSSAFVSALEVQIERSNSHWSELTEPHSDTIEEEEAAKIENEEVFKSLQRHSTWCHFFHTFGYDFGTYGSAGELVVGERFAEGAQAELYNARFKWENSELHERDLKEGNEWVVKVIKKGTLLRHLQLQWPHGLFHEHAQRERNASSLGNL